MTDVRHDAARHRFETEVDGHTGYVEYEPSDGKIAITHTIVPSEIGGRGIAAALVQAAAEHARENGMRIEPRCSYADAWMRRHPDFDALRA